MDSHYMDGHGLATRDGFSWSDGYALRLGVSHWHGGGTEFLSSSVPRALSPPPQRDVQEMLYTWLK